MSRQYGPPDTLGIIEVDNDIVQEIYKLFLELVPGLPILASNVPSIFAKLIQNQEQFKIKKDVVINFISDLMNLNSDQNTFSLIHKQVFALKLQDRSNEMIAKYLNITEEELLLEWGICINIVRNLFDEKYHNSSKIIEEEVVAPSITILPDQPRKRSGRPLGSKNKKRIITQPQAAIAALTLPIAEAKVRTDLLVMVASAPEIDSPFPSETADAQLDSLEIVNDVTDRLQAELIIEDENISVTMDDMDLGGVQIPITIEPETEMLEIDALIIERFRKNVLRQKKGDKRTDEIVANGIKYILSTKNFYFQKLKGEKRDIFIGLMKGKSFEEIALALSNNELYIRTQWHIVAESLRAEFRSYKDQLAEKY